MSILNEITQLLSFGFMQRALLAGICFGLLLPLIGSFMLVRKTAHIGDGLSHVAVTGSMLGLIVGFSPSFWAILVGVIAALFLEWARQRFAQSIDGLIVLIMSISLAFISWAAGEFEIQQSLESILFGSILTLSWSDVRLVLISTLLILALVLRYRQALLSYVIAGPLSKLTGVRTSLIGYAIMAAAGFVISLSLDLFGAVLVSGILVGPALFARNISSSFIESVWIGSGIGLVSVVSGLLLSWFADIPTGSSIIFVLVLIGIFTAAYSFIHSIITTRYAS